MYVNSHSVSKAVVAAVAVVIVRIAIGFAIEIGRPVHDVTTST